MHGSNLWQGHGEGVVRRAYRALREINLNRGPPEARTFLPRAKGKVSIRGKVDTWKRTFRDDNELG
jgi:hypothetical protein